MKKDRGRFDWYVHHMSFSLCFSHTLDSGEWAWLISSSVKSTRWRVGGVQVEGLRAAEAALAFGQRSPLLAPGTQQRDVQSRERGDTARSYCIKGFVREKTWRSRGSGVFHLILSMCGDENGSQRGVTGQLWETNQTILKTHTYIM